MAKPKLRWHVFSTRAGLSPDQPVVARLPKDAILSADGRWAEVYDEDGVLETVYVADEIPEEKQRQVR